MERRIINLDQLDYQRWNKGFPPDQLRNTSATEPSRVFAVSTFESPDIVEYPDSGKISFGGRFTGADGKPELVRGIARKGKGPGYWEGE